MAFVETTILVDALLAPRKERTSARDLLAAHSRTLLPVYAIKELKAGALRNYVWFHNKLALFSFADAMRALQRSALSPKRYTTATAIEALNAATETTFRNAAAWAGRYGDKATQPAEMFKDHVRLSLKRIIYRAWKDRRKVTSEVVAELNCYPEAPLTESSQGTIEIQPTKCETLRGCQLAREMSSDDRGVQALCDVLEKLQDKQENMRRLAALKKMRGDGWRTFEDKHCRAIGDAAFAMLAPRGVPILTTNTRDLEPLAGALGKSVVARH